MGNTDKSAEEKRPRIACSPAVGALSGALSGALAGLLYVCGGTLLGSIILHTAVDLHGGAVARRLHQTDQTASS